MFSLAILVNLITFSQERYIEIDGNILWINTIRIENRLEGQPVIVFESGLGTPMGHWEGLLKEVAGFAPVFTYDRPGISDIKHPDYLTGL